MSEFLLIAPEGWTQLDWQHITNNVPNMTYSQVMDKLNGGGLADIDTALKEAGVIAQDVTIVEAKLIDDTHFLVRLG